MEELLRVERDGASNSSSSQARHGEINNRARKTERISVMDRGRGQARGGTLKGAGGRFFMKVGGSRPAGAGLWRVLEIKHFWFMNEIVTGGVGQMRTYGPQGQVKGGRWPSVAPNPLRGGALEGLNV